MRTHGLASTYRSVVILGRLNLRAQHAPGKLGEQGLIANARQVRPTVATYGWGVVGDYASESESFVLGHVQHLRDGRDGAGLGCLGLGGPTVDGASGDAAPLVQPVLAAPLVVELGDDPVIPGRCGSSINGHTSFVGGCSEAGKYSRLNPLPEVVASSSVALQEAG